MRAFFAAKTVIFVAYSTAVYAVDEPVIVTENETILSKIYALINTMPVPAVASAIALLLIAVVVFRRLPKA
ncbi:MAG: hypothetical protein AAGD04_03145 [Pseudomonadota bacterium]